MTTRGPAEEVVDALRRFISRGEYGLKEVPSLVKEVIRGEFWRDRSEDIKQFEDFVTHAPREGLGADVMTLRRLCAEDMEALTLLDQVVGRRQGFRSDLVDDVHEVTPRPAGNSTAAALRRLAKDRPDLHARVLAGRTTAHRAMVEAGFRPPTAKIRVDDMRAAAATLRGCLSEQHLAELVRLLTEAR